MQIYFHYFKLDSNPKILLICLTKYLKIIEKVNYNVDFKKDNRKNCHLIKSNKLFNLNI